MKAGSWKLPAGMVLGLAGGFLLRPVVVTERGELRLFAEEEDANEAFTADSDALAGKSAARTSGKRSAGSPLAGLSSGDAVTDVRDLIASFEGLQSESQLNPMELIRRLYLLTQLREGEVLDVLASLADQKDGIGDPELGMMAGMIALTRLAELNGPEALRLIHSKELASIWDGSEDEVSVMMMNSWVAADPEGAQRWFEGGVKQLEQEEMQELMENDDFRQAYYDGMAKHDPEALAREISEDSDPDKRDEVMVALVRNAKAPDELVGLLDQCTGSSAARTEAIEKLSKADSAAAAAWVEKQTADDARDDDVRIVGLAMMEREREEGIEWYLAQELANDEQAGSRLSTIVDHLAVDDLEKAAEWVESRPDDGTRDSAEATLARRLARTDPDEAMDWLRRVEDSESREIAFELILADGWDYSEDRLRDGLIEAAEGAGMGEAARNFKPE